MAQLDKDSIAKLTRLSRIKCSPEEEEALLADLKTIVAYIEQLQQIDTADLPPCYHVLEDMHNVMREDVIGETMPREVFLANASSQIDGMVRVPPIIKSN